MEWEDIKRLNPSGNGQVRGVCPDCSHSRKKTNEKCLAINFDEQIAYCHHCGNGTAAVKKKATVSLPSYFDTSKKIPQEALDYFGKRKISKQTLRKEKIDCKIKFFNGNNIEPKGKRKAIAFPYYKKKQCVNIKYRTEGKQMLQEANAEKCLYRFDQIEKHTEEALIITEGEIDCLSFIEAGFEMVTSVPDGAPTLNAKNYKSKFNFLDSAYEIIKKYKKIILAGDNDLQGKKLIAELARRIGEEKCFNVKYPADCKDGNDVLKKFGKKSLRNVIEKAQPIPISGIYTVDDLTDKTIFLYEHGESKGALAGWSVLDQHYSVRTGEMTIVTGMPGSGKTCFLFSLFLQLMLRHNWKFGVFSAEMLPLERAVADIAEKLVGKPFFESDIYKKMTIWELKEAFTAVQDNFFFVMPKYGKDCSVDVILSKAKVLIKKYGISGFVIDPWNEVEHDYENLREDQYLSKQLSKIRKFARLNDIHIWIVAHPKNLRKDKDGVYLPPSMYDISGGAQWRNKADNGLCIHREDYKTKEVQVLIQKIRFREVGKIGKIVLYYEKESGSYKNGYIESEDDII